MLMIQYTGQTTQDVFTPAMHARNSLWPPVPLLSNRHIFFPHSFISHALLVFSRTGPWFRSSSDISRVEELRAPAGLLLSMTRPESQLRQPPLSSQHLLGVSITLPTPAAEERPHGLLNLAQEPVRLDPVPTSLSPRTRLVEPHIMMPKVRALLALDIATVITEGEVVVVVQLAVRTLFLGRRRALRDLQELLFRVVHGPQVLVEVRVVAFHGRQVQKAVAVVRQVEARHLVDVHGAGLDAEIPCLFVFVSN